MRWRGHFSLMVVGVAVLAAGCEFAPSPSPDPPAAPRPVSITAPASGGSSALATTTTSTPTPTTSPAPPPTTAPASTTTTTGPPTSGRLPGEPAVGVQFHATWSNYSDSERQTTLDKMAAAGVKWVRIDLGWASYEYWAQGQIESWYTQLADTAVNEARARGFHVLATLFQTPKWANGGAGTSAPPTNPADYARFAQWAAQHFQGRVDAWEVWNEPNMTDFWTGSAAQYAKLLEDAYPAIKAGDPHTSVVVGAPAYNDANWLAALYQAGIHGSFDVMATHPYEGFANAPPETADDGTRGTLTHVVAVHNLMMANGDAGKPIWFTEFGWSSHATAPGTPNWQWGVSDAQQGDDFVRTLRWIAMTAPYVTNVFWYTARNEHSGDFQNDNYGLLNFDLSPKVAYTTISNYLHS